MENLNAEIKFNENQLVINDKIITYSQKQI